MNISVANMIETLTMGIQGGFIESVEEIDAISSMVSRVTLKFLSDCQEVNHLPIDEMRETIESVDNFINVVINSHNIDFTDEVESHGLCLAIIDIFRTLGGLKSLLKL